MSLVPAVLDQVARARGGRRGLRLALCGLAGLAACARGAALDDRAIRDGLEVRLDGEGSTWRATLLRPTGRDGSVTEIALGREVHVPLGAEVRFTLTSRDFICDFALPQLGQRDFAAPGLPGQMRVRPERVGRYELRGDEMCGLPHGELALGWLVVENHRSWQAWLAARAAKRKVRTR